MNFSRRVRGVLRDTFVLKFAIPSQRQTQDLRSTTITHANKKHKRTIFLAEGASKLFES